MLILGVLASMFTAITVTRSVLRLIVVREWARNNGHKVSDRGRISAGILAAYDKANG